MKYIFLSLALVVSIISEVSLIPIPFLVIILCLFTLFSQSEAVFFFAIISGLMVDSLFFRPLGSTSLFLVIFLGLLFAYRQKFEVRSFWFAGIFGLWGIMCYFLLFGSSNFFVQVGLSILVEIGLYFVFSWRYATYTSQKLVY